MNRTEPLRVDIVSDVVCPWCIVGYRQLEAACEATQTPMVVFWHPFELNVDMPPEGQNLREHLAAKYGSTPEQSRAARDHLTQLGESLGFRFNYSDGMRMVNTFRAHQAIHWAGTHGLAHQMKMALFTAFFSDGLDVGDIDVLVDAAETVGLDRNEAHHVLKNGDFEQAVREEEQFWTSRGIQGVPAMVFDKKYLVTGAQGIDGYGRILEQIKNADAA